MTLLSFDKFSIKLLEGTIICHIMIERMGYLEMTSVGAIYMRKKRESVQSLKCYLLFRFPKIHIGVSAHSPLSDFGVLEGHATHKT